MNILPTKSWHVRNRDNIERVRRDEAKAAEEEKVKQERIALAEQEARTELLRKKSQLRLQKAGSSTSEPGNQVSSDSSAGLRHINFFQAEEDGTKHGKNAEYEAEKKAEKESYEKQIGLLTHLGQSSLELQQSKPWYYQKIERQKDKGPPGNKKQKLADEFQKKKKHGMDPLRNMSEYLHEKMKRHSKNEKPKDKSKASEKPKTIHKGKKSIEHLRAERLEREKKERRRSEKMLKKIKNPESAKEKEIVLDERERGYNSQFNPDFVRRRKKNHDFT